jgi:hypothetical protein
MGPYHVTQVREAVFSAEATTSSHVVSGTPVAALVPYPYIDFSNRKRIPALSRRWEGHGCDEAVVDPLSTLGRVFGGLAVGLAKEGFSINSSRVSPMPSAILISHYLLDSKAPSLVNHLGRHVYTFLPS